MHAVPPPPVDPTDVIFLLEASDVIGEAHFNRTKLFLSRLIGKLDIDSGSARVGIVLYSTEVGLGINLGEHSSVASLQSAIMSLNFTGGSSNTAAALAYVRTMMLTSAAGARIDVAKKVIIFTSGRSDDRRATQVGAMCNVHTVAVHWATLLLLAVSQEENFN